VLRGGSWALDGGYARSAYRRRGVPADRDDDLGFRLARGQAVRSGGPEVKASMPEAKASEEQIAPRLTDAKRSGVGLAWRDLFRPSKKKPGKTKS
jgi:hypothetical protein